MDIIPIETEEAYNEALKRLNSLMQDKDITWLGNEACILADRIEEYRVRNAIIQEYINADNEQPKLSRIKTAKLLGFDPLKHAALRKYLGL